MTTDSASEAMISTLKAYEMGVDDAESVVDRYNEIFGSLHIWKHICFLKELKTVKLQRWTTPWGTRHPVTITVT